MDTTETHYLNYDPEAIYREMLAAYIEAGGDVLYPGDEKEMLLRAVMSIVVQEFAYVDNRLRMATLRYAQGQYLDLIGEKRNCSRLEADYARATVEIRFYETLRSETIPAGTNVTADGTMLYALDEDITKTGYSQTVTASVTARDIGRAGNGLTEGTQMQFQARMDGVESVRCVESASGGQEEETDDAYRERIRTHGLANATTGPKTQYEEATLAVSSEILDARAETLGAGRVGIYILLADSTGSQAIIDQVYQALNDVTARPLTDTVEVYEATEISYRLEVKYRTEEGENIAQAVEEAVEKYSKWQDGTIGRAFNPDRLMAEVYRAGAMRVLWGANSHFNGGNVEYTEVPANCYARGEIVVEELT